MAWLRSVSGVLRFAPIAVITRAIKEAAFIAAHQTDADSYFQGWTSTVGWTITTVTTPDAARVITENYRATPGQFQKIICDWDGILDLTTPNFQGFASSVLTANAATLSGYNMPGGGLWFEAAAGRTPAFGNSTIDMIGQARIFFDGIGFAGKANGGVQGNIQNAWFRTTPTVPLRSIVAFKRCKFGLAIWRPAELSTEYVKAITAAQITTLHIEGCTFGGVYKGIAGAARYLRLWGNFSYKFVGDFVDHFGFYDTTAWPGIPVYAWLQNNVVINSIDQTGFNSIHTDFYQAGIAGDTHLGNNALIRWNVYHGKTSLSTGSGCQFFYSDDYTAARNSAIIYENIAAFSAYNFANIHDPSGQGNWWIEQNIGMSAGAFNVTEQTAGVFPVVTVSTLASSAPTTNGGTISVQNNYFGQLNNSGAYPVTLAGNWYTNPRAGVTSGDGSTAALAQRPEIVFTLPGAVRDGSDRLTYSIIDETTTDFATAFYALVDNLKPLAGWAVQAGPSNPATWPSAPARPAPIISILPVISGTPTQGQTQTATTGTWFGKPTTFTYQWYNNGTAISAATASTYVPGAGDVGATLTCAVTATNVTGPTASTSAPTSTIAASTFAPSVMLAPTLTQIDRTSMTLQRAAAPADGGSAITSYDARYSLDGATGWITVTGVASPATIAGLSAGTLYYMQTRAVNAVGVGAWSPSKALQTVFDYRLYNEAGSTTFAIADLAGLRMYNGSAWVAPSTLGLTVVQDVDGELLISGFAATGLTSAASIAAVGVHFEQQQPGEPYSAADTVATANTTGTSIRGIHYLELIAGTPRALQNTPQPGFPVAPTRELSPVTGS